MVRFLIALTLVLVSAPAFAGDAASNYKTYCSSCHGEAGKGDGPAGKVLTPPARDLTDAAYMKGRTDEQLFKVIKEGGSALGLSPVMTPWGGILKTDESVKEMVAYVRAFSQEKGK